MSIPPIRRDSFEAKVHPPDAKLEESKEEEIDPFIEGEQAIHKAVDLSISSRGEKLKTLSPKISSQLEALENSFAILRPLCLKICSLNTESRALEASLDELSSDDENEHIVKQRTQLEAQIDALEDPIEKAEQDMKAFIQKLLDEFHDLGIKKEFFSDWWQLDRIGGYKQELSLKYMEEQLLNRCLNQVCFIDDMTSFMEEKKGEIIEIFHGDPAHLDLQQVSFELVPHGSETHNRGKVPIKVNCRLGEAELFSFFLKPRGAQIDKHVIQIFSDLNALPIEEKSLDIDLPTYTITNMDYKGQSISLWEFIEGQHLHGSSANKAINNLPSSPEEKKSLNQQILRLESVCKFLDISDLHLENLIFAHLGEDNAQVIPIDLESIQPNHSTGLYDIEPDEIPPFTESEIAILDRGKAIIKDVPVRFVPIPTSHFLAGLTRCDSFISMANFIDQSIQRKSYTLCIPKEELEWLVLNDFLHNDVPYLTEYKSQIYYGLPNEGRIIARRL